MNLSAQKKIKGVFCCAHSCKNKPAEKLGGLCSKHYQRKRRKVDPVGQRYTQFKANALKRKKDFSITLEEFRDFCRRTGYLIVKGRRGKAATIDRRCNIHGYHIWNIQILTLSRNASKGAGFSGDNFECPF
jgi:hypothetical protein